MIVQNISPPHSSTTIDMSNNDDITTLSLSSTAAIKAITTETLLLPHTTTATIIPELQLCINDLVHPTETAETLLETLSTEQLNIIEQAVNKIKERKVLNKDKAATANTTPLLLSTVTTATPNSPIDISSCSSSIIEEPTKIAKALAEVLSATSLTTNNNKQSLSQPSAAVSTEITTNKPDTKSNTSTTTTTTNNTTNNNSTAKPPTTAANTNTATTPSPFLSGHEPTTEIKEGVEWVSFVYSHHRTLRRYCIRTDLDQVDTSILDEKFKKENCVYPRANLPRETYRGNRWAYETECNVLGWKLAYLNLEEIAGKRGLIQRAVDSYRNRYPSMRSRRVARQEKLLKGTLRKRKHRDNETTEGHPPSKSAKQNDTPVIVAATAEKAPKTILIEDKNIKCRIRINIESVVLDAVDLAFRKSNCVFPRAMHITSETPCVTQRRLDEAKCNEIGWKLAWLNPRQLANKKNLLQRALDTWRKLFTADLKPRKYASRLPPTPYVPPTPQARSPSSTQDENVEMIEVKQEEEQQDNKIPLTEQALAEQQKEFHQSRRNRRDSQESFYSGTTVTLDFHDYCFSPPAEEEEVVVEEQPFVQSGNMFDDLILAALPISDVLSDEGSSSNETLQNTPSPAESLMTFYQQALLLNSTAVEKEEENNITNSNVAAAALVDFMTKYQNAVDAGMGGSGSGANFIATADPNLSNQLF